MKKLMFLIVLVLIGFMFSGCSDMNQDITSANTDKVPVPFKGNFEGIAVTGTETCNLGVLPKVLTVTGNSTHLGKFTAEVKYCITYPAPPSTPGYIVEGYGTMTAANGDKLYLTDLEGYWYFNTYPPNPTAEIAFVLGGDILSGTGKFSDATGSFEGSGIQIFDPQNDPTPTTFSWDGTIMY